MPKPTDAAYTRTFATEWIAAWNAGDLERIFRLYRDDFEMRSPLIAERGFAALRRVARQGRDPPYWSVGIATASPPLFELVEYAGIGTVASLSQRRAAAGVVEVIAILDDSGSRCAAARVT